MSRRLDGRLQTSRKNVTSASEKPSRQFGLEHSDDRRDIGYARSGVESCTLSSGKIGIARCRTSADQCPLWVEWASLEAHFQVRRDARLIAIACSKRDRSLRFIDLWSSHTARVNRIILNVRRSLSVYPRKQTISEPVGTSHLCQVEFPCVVQLDRPACISLWHRHRVAQRG